MKLRSKCKSKPQTEIIKPDDLVCKRTKLIGLIKHIIQKTLIEITELEDLPYDDNDEIQHVPTVSHVRILVHHQAVSNNLQKGLNCENDEEGILNGFLQTQKKYIFLIGTRHDGLS